LEDAPLTLNAVWNLQVNSVSGLERVSCFWLVVAVHTVLHNVPVRIVFRVRTSAALVATRAVRPPDLSRSSSGIHVSLSSVLASELAAVARPTSVPLHTLVVCDCVVEWGGWSNLKHMLVQHRLGDWGCPVGTAIGRDCKPEFKMACMVCSDGSFNPCNTTSRVCHFGTLRAESTSSHECFAVSFVTAQTVVTKGVPGCFLVGWGAATHAVQIGNVVVRRVSVGILH